MTLEDFVLRKFQGRILTVVAVGFLWVSSLMIGRSLSGVLFFGIFGIGFGICTWRLDVEERN